MFVAREAITGNLIIALWSLVQIVQCTPGTPFPTCMDVKQKCALGCKEVPIFMFPHTGKYSSNVFCFNNSPSVETRPYRLTGCPTTYFNSLQNTSGICSITTEGNMTDLLLTTNDLVTGFHSFDCLFGESPTGMVSSSAIVVNAHAPYRDFFVNGVLQYDHENIALTNITVQVGDELSVVARAFGNVTVITADHDGFICVKGFACNQHTRHDVSNRYLRCFLSSPAELSDSGKTLTISVNNMELKRFVITVIKRLPAEPLMSSPPDTEAEPTSITPDTTATTTTTTSTAKEMDFDIKLSIPAIVCVFVLIVIVLGIVVYYEHTKCVSNQTKSIHGERHNEEGRIEKSDSCVEKEVFNTFYAKLGKILPVVDNIYNMLVPEGILVPGDIQEINSFPRSEHKAFVVLQKISSSLQAGKTDSFYRLLKVMDTSLNNDVKDLVVEVRRALLMAVFISSCPHYEQLRDKITRRGYYVIMKAPTPSDNMLRTSLDQGIPLITCGCSECELPGEVAKLLRTPTIPDSWNILYLHQNGSGDVMQCNGRIKVIHIDLNNGSLVVDWLRTKLPRMSSSVGWTAKTRYLQAKQYTSKLVLRARPFFRNTHQRHKTRFRVLRKKGLARETTSEWRMIKSNVTTI